ncbi:MAG: ribosome assembly factor SBDS [Nanoarchaeota archaeon]
MVSIEKAQIARLKSHGHTFEILVDSNLAMDFKHGKSISIGDILAISKVFADAKKGDEASSATMKEVFKTEDHIEAAKIILEKGEIPMTTEYRNKIRDQKRKQVINIICRDGVDPKTNLPHPMVRIENAMDEIKFHVDESTDVKQLVEEALKKIRPILPIKFVVKEMAVKIPSEYAAKSYPIIQQFGKKLREDWQNDGSYLAVVEIPGGMEEDFHNSLNALTHGNVETKILNIR